MWGPEVVAGEAERAWEVQAMGVLALVGERRLVVQAMVLRQQVVRAEPVEEWGISRRWQVLALALGGAQRRHSPLEEQLLPGRERGMEQVKEKLLPPVQEQEELVKAPGSPQVLAHQHKKH